MDGSSSEESKPLLLNNRDIHSRLRYDNEEEPLNQPQPYGHAARVRACCTGCWSWLRANIIVEPLLLLFMFCMYPISQIRTQFVYLSYSWQFSNGTVRTFNAQVSDCLNHSTSAANATLSGQVQAASAQFFTVFSLLTLAPALPVGLLIGAYSDRLGRRFGILIPLLGDLLSALVFTLVVVLNLPLWVVLLSAFINGSFGSTFALLNSCLAYIVDKISSEQRSLRILLVELIGLCAALVSAILTGRLLLDLGFTPLVLSLMTIKTLGLLYALFYIPETIKVEVPNQKLINKLREEPLKPLRDTFSVVFSKGQALSICLLLGVFFFYTGQFVAQLEIDSLYAMNRPLCWSPVNLGDYLAVTLFTYSLGAVLTRLICRRCCKCSDITISLTSSVPPLIATVLKGLSTQGWMFMLAPFVGFSALLTTAHLRAVISTHVPDDSFGSVFGLIAFTEVAANLAGSVGFNALYAATVRTYAGITYLTMAACILVAVLLLAIYKLSQRRLQKNSTKNPT